MTFLLLLYINWYVKHLICPFQNTLLVFIKKAQLSRGELGRFPLRIDIAVSILQFYKHLQQLKSDTVLHEAYETSVPITHQTRKSWNESCKNIIKCIEDNTNIGADVLFD